jgi:mannose-1-phosphate guanylyltransferase / mannose-6-phosphate isomerase
MAESFFPTLECALPARRAFVSKPKLDGGLQFHQGLDYLPQSGVCQYLGEVNFWVGNNTVNVPEKVECPGYEIMAENRIVPIILSGGSGTRLWPVSRESFPKQLWPLVSERTMMQETALRAVAPALAPPIVVCNNEHRFLIAEQLRAVGIMDARIVLEPVGRNSAPAIAAAALLVAETDPDAVLWIMAADSSITDNAALRLAVQTAARAAHNGHVVTFGMKPTNPEIGYGYIEIGAHLSGSDGVYAVARFLEKPDVKTAARFVSDGRHLWNSGMFVFTARTLLEELEQHAPEILPAVRQAVADLIIGRS